MWRASPIGWNGRAYHVEEDRKSVARVEFGAWNGSGGIVLDDQRLAITREGFWNPRFHLLRDLERVATAHSAGAFTRSFHLDHGGEEYRLDPSSVWSRSFSLTRRGSYLGRIASAGTFSRVALIELDPELAPELRLFAFWMVALAWRRGAAVAAAT